MRTIKVLVADRHTMFRQFFEGVVNAAKSFRLCASTPDLSALPALCADHQPDLVLVDPELKLSVLRRIREDFPWIKLLVMTDRAAWELPLVLREMGVHTMGYKNADHPPVHLLLERTIAGQSIFPEASPLIQIGLAVGNDFTPRERDVLRYLLEGYSNSVIASHLGISEHAVHYHVNNMLSKTGYTNRIKLAVMVERSGFVISAEEYRNMK